MKTELLPTYARNSAAEIFIFANLGSFGSSGKLLS